ncbi:hypothetical protein DPMN_042000 [Dreissena polymorpha]|uniref:Uncharacterized protein n=1 Tax=Dreissena polymorpha TaxID=45954 RepID=A0A9D4D172_DREPO|nr:hypothetical protein DPMN_042000 [Dreissena polymorpha]
MLMSGSELNHPSLLMFPTIAKKCGDTEYYVSNLMEKSNETACGILKTSTKSMKRNFDLLVLPYPYAEGHHIVMLKLPS